MFSRRVKIFIIISVVLILAGLLSQQMLSLDRAECSFCLSFKGQTQCVNARGQNRKQALEEARRNACALLAEGVTDTLACNREPAGEISCKTRP